MGWFALGMISAVLPAMAFAQTAAQRPASPPPQVWQLDWKNNYCAVSTGDTATAGLAVWMTPGDPNPDLFFVGSPMAVPEVMLSFNDKVTLLPSRESFSGWAMNMGADSHGRVLRLLHLEEAFPAVFANSSEVRLEGMKQAIPTVGSGKAIAALRKCIDDKLTAWGVDAKAYEALRMPATGPAGRWISRNDYPKDASAALEQGDVIARMDVDATGKVTNCTVVVSSGSKSLDSVTCASALRRAKFNPAIGADGKPTASQRIVRVAWRIID
jgi:TonB family protein